MVLVEKAAPAQVRVGETFEYHIRVTNTAKSNLYDVTVWDQSLENFKITMSDPDVMSIKGPWTTWNLGTLAPGAAKLIKIEGMATSVCMLRPCSEVTYRMEQVCLPIEVVQPSLTLTKTAPSEILQCDPVPVKFVVKNVGTGQACNVVITDPLPDGLEGMDGKKSLMFAAGTLNAGESREFTAQLKATKTGTFTNMAVARADGGLRADAPPTTTVVVKPELSVSKVGPDMRYIGRPITYHITVVNGPQATASNTVLTDSIPADATFVSASDGGKLQGDKVTWNLGTLKPRGTKKVSVTMKAAKACVVRNIASVTASCGSATGEASTVIKGIPAILLEVIDLADPIEVNGKETYEITVTNQGSAMGTNIQVMCHIPSQMVYVDSMGPAKAAVDGQKVTFAPLKSLDPGAKAVYRVTVKAVRTGDVRFKVMLKSDQMETPAEETEATRLYK